MRLLMLPVPRKFALGFVPLFFTLVAKGMDPRLVVPNVVPNQCAEALVSISQGELSQLRVNADWFQRFMENAPGFACIIDADLRYVVVNRYFRENYGGPPGEVVGRRTTDLFPASVSEQARAYVERLNQLDSQILRDGNSVSTALEFPVQGGMLQHFLVSKFLLLNERGERFVGTMAVDISELRRSEQRNQGLASLLDVAPHGMILRDLEGQILFWNRGAEQIYGYSSSEAIGRRAAELIYPNDAVARTAVEGYMSATIENGEWRGELSQRNRSGQEILIESRWVLVRDAEGRPLHILSVNTDITERRRREEALARGQRHEALGALSAGIAHDLNNTLTPIMMGSHLLRNPNITAEVRNTMLDAINASADRAAEMVRQLTGFARGTTERREPLQIVPLVNEFQMFVRQTFPMNIEVVFEMGKNLTLIEGNATQLHQVLLNLAVNAKNAMPNGGKLTIKVENQIIDPAYVTMNPEARVGSYVVIRVSDTGAGIPENIRHMIFVPYFTTRPEQGGTGIGLANVQAIVRNHEGFITFHSRVRQGTEFSVYLPTVRMRNPQEGEGDRPVEVVRGNGETILVVDDQSLLRDVARASLESYGYRVITAANGAEALATFAASRVEIRLVLLDMDMPVMNGAQALTALRSLAPTLPIVMASGLELPASLTNPASPPAERVSALLPKPYSGEGLLPLIRNLLNPLPNEVGPETQSLEASDTPPG